MKAGKKIPKAILYPFLAVMIVISLFFISVYKEKIKGNLLCRPIGQKPGYGFDGSKRKFSSCHKLTTDGGKFCDEPSDCQSNNCLVAGGKGNEENIRMMHKCEENAGNKRRFKCIGIKGKCGELIGGSNGSWIDENNNVVIFYEY